MSGNLSGFRAPGLYNTSWARFLGPLPTLNVPIASAEQSYCWGSESMELESLETILRDLMMSEHRGWEGSMAFSSHPLAISLSLAAGRGGFARKGITKTFCQPITYHSLGKIKEQLSKGPGVSQLMGPIIGLNPTF